jgi:hypothetical protein
MSAYYLIRLRALRPFPVQLRLTYLVLLGAGTVPGLGGFHLILLAGTTVMVTTGYCLLGRTLSLLSYNRSAPLSRSLVQRVLLSPVGDGGLFCWLGGEADSLPVGRCSLRSPLHHPAERAGNCEG